MSSDHPKLEVVSADAPPKVSIVRRILGNITVEPLVICWLLPFLLTYAAIENLNLEKACRGFVDPSVIGFEKDICKIFVRKADFGISCEGNNTSIESVEVADIQRKFPDIYESIKDNLTEAINFLCETEEKVQNKMTEINSIRNPISAIGPLIIILFAGPWSDKKNLRVPCMFVPFLGEAVGYFSLFISAIFINGPVEFPAYAYRLIPSLTGAENLMVMGIFSYLSACSTEDNRTFRFGMFQILMTIVPIIAQSLSPTVNEKFEYTQLFGMMIPVHIIGLIYTLVFLKEVKPKATEDAAYDNPAMENELTSRSQESTLQIHETAIVEESKRNACLEFFDPRLANQCVKTFFKKREYGVRSIIILLMLMHFITNGINLGESQNAFLYQRQKLRWDVDTHIYNNVFAIVLGLIGTLLMVGVLSKYLKVPDIVLTLISTCLTFITRIVYSVVTSTVGFFIGTAVDFCSSVKILGVRAIVSKLVPSEDLSTMFAIMGLFEALSGLIFPYIYPTYYIYLLNNTPRRDVSEMYHMSAAFVLITFIVYSLVFKLLRTKEKAEVKDDPKNKQSTKF